MPRGLFLGYGLGASDEMAAFLQDEERPLLCIATDQVEDHIDLLVIATASGDDEAYLNSLGASRVINYRETGDSQIGRVLTAMHGDMARLWTVEELEAEEGM